MIGRRIGMWGIGVLIVGLYAYTVVAAVGNLLGMAEMAGLLGMTLSGVGVFWLIFGIAVPCAVLSAALLLGRRRTAGLRVLMLAAGVAAVAAWQLEISHLVPQSTFFV